MSDQSSNPVPPKTSRRKKILRGLGIAFLLLVVIGIVQFWPRPHDALTRYIPGDALIVVKIEPYTFIENFKGHYKDIANSPLTELSKDDSTACKPAKNPLKFGIDLALKMPKLSKSENPVLSWHWDEYVKLLNNRL